MSTDEQYDEMEKLFKINRNQLATAELIETQ